MRRKSLDFLLIGPLTNGPMRLEADLMWQGEPALSVCGLSVAVGYLCKYEVGREVDAVQFLRLLQLPPLVVDQDLDGVLQLLAAGTHTHTHTTRRTSNQHTNHQRGSIQR